MILAILVVTAAINGLLVWPPFVVFLGLQGVLALYTTFFTGGTSYARTGLWLIGVPP